MTDAAIAEAIDATWCVRPRMEPMTAALFITLWAARGRTVTLDYLTDAIFQLRAERPTTLGLRSTVKRLRKTIAEAGWPVTVTAVYALGYRLDAQVGWDWRTARDGDVKAGLDSIAMEG